MVNKLLRATISAVLFAPTRWQLMPGPAGTGPDFLLNPQSPAGWKLILALALWLSQYEGGSCGFFAMRTGVASLLAIGLVLAACARRDPHPISVVQPQDTQSDCAMI